MSDLRDAVEQVRADAGQRDLVALETVLLDQNAERAARLTAANLLARAGQDGLSRLRTTIRAGDTLAQCAALKAYLLAQGLPDEDLLLQVAHAERPTLRRQARRLINRLPYPISDELRLRVYLPAPYWKVPDPGAHLAVWLQTPGPLWQQVVQAVGLVNYTAAIPLLVSGLKTAPQHPYPIVAVLKGMRGAAIPALLEALPQSQGDARAHIWHLLTASSDPRAREAVAELMKRAQPALTAAAHLPYRPSTDGPTDWGEKRLGRRLAQMWNRLRGK